MTGLKIGICGGGVGGLAAAIALRMVGHDPHVFEQADAFLRIGADVNLTPNAVHALDGLGVGEVLRETAARPTHRISRTWDTGEETSRLPMSDAAEERYGAPQLTLHRADLLKALEDQVPADRIHLGRRVTALSDGGGTTVDIHFAGGPAEPVDVDRRRRRHSFGGAHGAVRPGQAAVHRPGLLPRGGAPRRRLPRSRTWTPSPNGGVPTPDVQIVVFPADPRRGSVHLRDHAAAGLDGRGLDPARAMWRSCARPTATSTRRRAPCSTPARRSPSPRSTCASPWPPGRRATPRCLATRRTRWCPSWPRAPAWRSRTRWCSPARSRALTRDGVPAALRALRRRPPRAHRRDPAPVARQRMDEGAGQRRLGLRLPRLGGGACRRLASDPDPLRARPVAGALWRDDGGRTRRDHRAGQADGGARLSPLLAGRAP